MKHEATQTTKRSRYPGTNGYEPPDRIGKARVQERSQIMRCG